MVFLSANDDIQFEKELENIKNYVEIEKFRFKDRINIEYDIKVTDFFVPVLSIQPMVENAIKHGICKKLEGGTVKISTYQAEDSICIIIEDNGVGFDMEEVKNDGKTHIGIQNVRTRVTNSGGTFNIESKKGIGTKVIILYKIKGGVDDANICSR